MKNGIRRMFAGVLSAVLLAGSVCAAESFTRSVTQKGAPEIVTTTDEKGEEIAAIIRDEKKEDVAAVPVGDLIITPLAEAEEAAETIKENLKSAYEQIKAAETLTEVAPDLEQVVAAINENVLAALEEKLAAYDEFETVEDVKAAAPEQVPEELQAILDKEVKMEDLVVRDLIDVTMTDEYRNALAQGANNVTISFQLQLEQDELLIVLHNYEADQWEIIPEDRVVRQEDGSVQVTFDSLSPVAFVVNSVEYHKGEAPAEESEAPVVPENENPLGPNKGLLWTGIVIVALGALGMAYAMSGMKKGKKKDKVSK